MRLLYPLHGGDPIMFELGNVFWPANWELDTEWYAAFGGVKFWLHTKTIYRGLLLNGPAHGGSFPFAVSLLA